VIRAWYVALAILLAPAGVAGQQAERATGPSSLTGIFEAANVAASRGDHLGAISNFRKLTEAGVHDPDVYFNLATSFAQSGDYPRAILNYERALTLRPGDSKASENLRAAEKALEEQRAEAEGEAMIQRSSSLSDAVYGGLSEDGLAIALLVFCALGLGAKAGMLRDGPRAVALGERLVLREGPDPRAQVRGEARGGDRGEIVDRDRDFVKLRVVNGLEGWTPSAGIGFIDPDHGVH